MSTKPTWHDCETLQKKTKFQWCRTSDQKIILSGDRPSITREKYEEAIGLLDRNPQGVSMKTLVTEVFNGNTRPAYNLGAILVCEDICEYERAGRESRLRLTDVRTSGALPRAGAKGQALEKARDVKKYLSDFSKIRKNSLSRLSNLSTTVNTTTGELIGEVIVKPSRIQQDWEESIESDLNEFESDGSHHFIYVFRVSKAAISKFRAAMLRAKQENSDRKFSRLNDHKYDKATAHAKNNGVIYVGSSRDKISYRIKQHLGLGPKTTYSLQMRSWADWVSGNVTISVLRLPKGTSREALQAVEDSMWCDLLPEFGRQGAR